MNYRGRSYWEDHQAISLMNLLSKHKWQWLFWYGSFKGFKFCGMRSDRPTDNSVTPSFCSEAAGRYHLCGHAKSTAPNKGSNCACSVTTLSFDHAKMLLPKRALFLHCFRHNGHSCISSSKSCMYSCGMLPSRPSLSTSRPSFSPTGVWSLENFLNSKKIENHRCVCVTKSKKDYTKLSMPLSCNKSIMSIP